MGACITFFILNLEKLCFANRNRKAFLKQKKKALFEGETEKIFGKVLAEKGKRKITRYRTF